MYVPRSFVDTNYFCYVKNESLIFMLGVPSIKDVSSQGWDGGLSNADIFQIRGWGVFRCGHLHFLAQNPSNFLKFIVCPQGQGGRFFTILCGRL